jgi:hypothetical protein
VLITGLRTSPDQVSTGFLSVEGNEVVQLDLHGKIVAAYVFERMDLHDVAVTPDEQRLLGVGDLTSSLDGLSPRMSKEENRIVGTLLWSNNPTTSLTPFDSVPYRETEG